VTDLLPVKVSAKKPKNQNGKECQEYEFEVLSQGGQRYIKKRQYFIRKENENSIGYSFTLTKG
jgi:hypothetical protein